MPHSGWITLTISIFAMTVSGCGQQSPPPPTEELIDVSSMSPVERSEFSQEIHNELERIEGLEATDPPVFELPRPEYWVVSEPRSLGGDGFSVAYQNGMAPTVTLYQYTRGHKTIPNDLNSPILLNEVEQVCNGIEQIAMLKQYEADQIEKGRKTLGDSATEAHSATYMLNFDGQKKRSDAYIWSHNNAILKLRITWNSEGAPFEQKWLHGLLTEFGKACETQ